MLKTIIIPISDWQNIDVAVTHAAALAIPLSARVLLVGLMSDRNGDVSSKFIDPVMWTVTRSEFEATLQQHVQYLKEQNIETEVEMMQTPSMEALFRYVSVQNCKLIVVPVGSEIRSPFVDSLLKHAYIPVLLAHTGIMPSYRNILVPLDGSQRAESSLNLAVSIARATGAQLHLAYVALKPDLPRSIRVSTEDLDIAQQLVERNAEEAKRYINQVATSLSLEVNTHVMIDQKVTTALHNLAVEQSIDLLILSAHGASGEPQWPLGTVAENLVRHSQIPTIVVQDLPAHLSNLEPEVVPAHSGTR